MRMQDEGAPLAVVATPVLETLTRTEIESQMEWAWKHKRDLAAVRRQALAAATCDEATAKECFYTLPARGDSDPIRGSSVRLAEIVYSIFGNLRAGSRIIDIGQCFVTAQGVCLDLETNVSRSVEVPRRITNKHGVRYGEDMIWITCMAAMSIAFRNAVLQVIPAVYTDPICEAARRKAIGSAETLGHRRKEMITHYGKMGVSRDLVLQSIGRGSIDEVSLEDLETLVGVANAIKGGDMSVDEAFPGVSDTKEKPQTLAEAVDREEPKAEPIGKTMSRMTGKPKVGGENPLEPVDKRPEPTPATPDVATDPAIAELRLKVVTALESLPMPDQTYVLGKAQMKTTDEVAECTSKARLQTILMRVEGIQKERQAAPA